MKRLAITTVALAGLAFTPAAEAARFGGFVVRDAGAEIKWGVTVCTNAAVIRNFQARLEDDEGGWERFHFYSDRSSGCVRHHLSVPDRFANGWYHSRVRISIGEGHGLVGFTRWKTFRIYG